MNPAKEGMKSSERMLECVLEGCINTFKEHGDKRFCSETHRSKQKRLDERIFDTRKCRVCGTEFTTHKLGKALCDDPDCTAQNKKDWDKKHNDRKRTSNQKLTKKKKKESDLSLIKVSVKKEEWLFDDYDAIETQVLENYFDNGGTVTRIGNRCSQ
jgi:hypothetical protein